MPEQINRLPKRKFKVMNLVWTIIMIAGLFISINVTNTHISVLFENWDQFADLRANVSPRLELLERCLA